MDSLHISHLDLSKAMHFKISLETLLIKELKVEWLAYKRRGVKYCINLSHVWNKV